MSQQLPPLRETVITILLEQDPSNHKKDGCLFLYPTPPPPPISHLQRRCLNYVAPILSGVTNVKLRRKFKLPWIVSQAMQASCRLNINDSFQILRLINFVRLVHQIGGVSKNRPTTKHAGSSSSSLVMTTSLIMGFLFQGSCEQPACGSAPFALASGCVAAMNLCLYRAKTCFFNTNEKQISTLAIERKEK